MADTTESETVVSDLLKKVSALCKDCREIKSFSSLEEIRNALTEFRDVRDLSDKSQEKKKLSSRRKDLQTDLNSFKESIASSTSYIIRYIAEYIKYYAGNLRNKASITTIEEAPGVIKQIKEDLEQRKERSKALRAELNLISDKDQNETLVTIRKRAELDIQIRNQNLTEDSLKRYETLMNDWSAFLSTLENLSRKVKSLEEEIETVDADFKEIEAWLETQTASVYAHNASLFLSLIKSLLRLIDCPVSTFEASSITSASRIHVSDDFFYVIHDDKHYYMRNKELRSIATLHNLLESYHTKVFRLTGLQGRTELVVNTTERQKSIDKCTKENHEALVRIVSGINTQDFDGSHYLQQVIEQCIGIVAQRQKLSFMNPFSIPPGRYNVNRSPHRMKTDRCNNHQLYLTRDLRFEQKMRSVVNKLNHDRRILFWNLTGHISSFFNVMTEFAVPCAINLLRDYLLENRQLIFQLQDLMIPSSDPKWHPKWIGYATWVNHAEDAKFCYPELFPDIENVTSKFDQVVVFTEDEFHEEGLSLNGLIETFTYKYKHVCPPTSHLIQLEKLFIQARKEFLIIGTGDCRETISPP